MRSSLLAAAAFAVLLMPTAAPAADYREGGGQVVTWCPPPGTPKAYREVFDGPAAKPPVYLTPYDPPYQIYVKPQTAFLVSDPCPNQYRWNWYEGKVWYYGAGSPQGPDAFRILKQD